ncbi:MAG TPA: Hsp20/alpha crystallin family protein [Gammaproteobacteria bacterium]|nr:Hsp20/alpha crystallin family protein [Gammaproteobacteria bacterium]
MDVVRYRPNRNIANLGSELARLFDSPLFDTGQDLSTVETSQWVPSVDIREEPNRFVVSADIPGVKPEDIEVTMENGTLAIRGERSEERDESSQGMRRLERVQGTFYRRFSLPETADPNGIRARGENGVLHIEIDKREQALSRRIPVEG